MRTTIDIDDPILRELKRLQEREGKSLGRLVSDLLAASLAEKTRASTERPPFNWLSRPMRARVDLNDKHTVLDAMNDAAA